MRNDDEIHYGSETSNGDGIRHDGEIRHDDGNCHDDGIRHDSEIEECLHGWCFVV
jgi:hypothetical protein